LNIATGKFMESSWFWIDTGACDAATNMAFDVVLLENAARLSAPMLRFYGWTQPSASFGYFQKYDEISRMTPLRPLVRRPTGGGLVLHDHDWTYSVVVPPGHGWFELAARESYQRIHEWLRQALAFSELTTELCSSRITEQSGVCFAGAEVSDLLQQNRKVAGAAQRRNEMGLLIQGSIAPSKGWPARDRWQESMRRVWELEQGVNWTIWTEDLSFKARVQVSAQKFGSEIFTRKR
jgi:lipoate-protein ligase A